MIKYPSVEWLNAYMAAHNCDRETADIAWWDSEIDKGHPTPFDITDEQAKVAKTMVKARRVDAYGKPHTKERKPDPDKREIMDTVAHNLSRVCSEDLTTVEGVEVVNPEREIRFRFRGAEYSLTLVKHRAPKG